MANATDISNYVRNMSGKKIGKANFGAAKRLPLALLLGTTALCGLVSPASAALAIWDGSESPDWLNPGNWDIGTPPTAADKVEIDTTGANAPVIGMGVTGHSQDIYVAYLANGLLTIRDGGGLLTDGIAYIGNGSPALTGIVRVTGAGSTWNVASTTIIGRYGNGELHVENGASVTGNSASIGSLAGVSGLAVVSGPGSVWNTGFLVGVGNSGSGTVLIENGGAWNTGLTTIGANAGSSGHVTVTGADSLWTNAAAVVVGDSGNGVVEIADGGHAMVAGSSGISVGDKATGNGAITVTGAGSLLSADHAGQIGNEGTGSLIVSGGAHALFGSSLYAGDAVGGHGAVTVSGAGSQLSVANSLTLGSSGAGTLQVNSGGYVLSGSAAIGAEAGSTGEAVVTGANAQWEVTNTLLLGGSGSGQMTISGGGHVVAGAATIGDAAGALGTLIVTGAGSLFAVNADLVVGNDGSGNFVLASGGMLDASQITLAQHSGSAGTLYLGAGGAAGTTTAGLVQFGDGDGRVVFNHNGAAYTFGAGFFGTGAIDHLGGTTILTGDGSGFDGTTTVSGGTLRVNGVLGGAFEVTSGGKAGGSGTLGTVTIGSGGTLAPGNSIGTMNVASVAFNAGSIYEVEINALGQSDLLAATGAAALAGTVHVVPFPDYALNTPYLILTAGGGVSGAFSGIDFPGASYFLSPQLTYTSNAVTLTLAASNFQTAALTPNQIAAAGAAQGAGPGDGVYDAIALVPDAASAQAAFDAISGELHASLLGVLSDDSRYVREAAIGRLRDTGGEEGGRVWAYGFGASGERDGDGNAAAADASTAGGFIGADFALNGVWRLGAVAGFQHSDLDIDARASSASIDTVQFGVYGGGRWDRWALRAGGAYAAHDVETDRIVAFPGFSDAAGGSYDATTWQLFAELAYRFEAGATGIEPFVRIAHVAVDTDAFDETGGAVALEGADGSLDADLATLGVNFDAAFSLGGADAKVRGQIGWRHAFDDSAPRRVLVLSGNQAFEVAGLPVQTDAAAIALGLDVTLSPGASLSVSYDGLIGDAGADHGVNARLALRF